jgi:hypothetical protein|tara:strand:- start:2140 stop:2334 length:195 start_codon:yes stop_codon:yes gene_type:complete
MENRERTTTTTTTLTFDVKIGEIQGGRRDSHRRDDLLEGGGFVRLYLRRKNFIKERGETEIYLF